MRIYRNIIAMILITAMVMENNCFTYAVESEVYSGQNGITTEEGCFEENVDYENLEDISASEEDVVDESDLENEVAARTDFSEFVESINGNTELSNPQTDANGKVTWDCVWFGLYWQEDTNNDGKTDREDDVIPIKWRVLSVNDNDVLLIADKALENRRHCWCSANTNWKSSEIRKWLNDEFYYTAFSSEERNLIKRTHVIDISNEDDELQDEEEIEDDIFLLSYEDVVNPEYGFAEEKDFEDNARKSLQTQYNYSHNENSSIRWWLRSSGTNQCKAMRVNSSGTIGESNVDEFLGVRPVLHVTGNTGIYAGTVCSDGTNNELDRPYNNSNKIIGYDETVNTKYDLIRLAKQVNDGCDFRDRVIAFNNDIDMTGIAWESIGTATNRFRGSIDGRGYSIKNLSGGNFIGVMEITEDANIENLKLENYSYTNAVATGCGGLVGSVITTNDDNQSSLIIKHCSILGKIVRDSDLGVGGVIGYIDTSGNDYISIDSL